MASLAFGNPEDAFGQKRAAVIFRESWFFGWLKKNAPDVNFKVYALPCEKACPGAGALFPWTDLVYKNSPNKQVAWEFMRFISNAKDDMDHHQLQGILPVWTANLDSDVREIAARLPVHQSHARADRCRRLTSIRNRTSWRPPSAKPSSAFCSAKDSPSRCWTKRRRRWIASSRTSAYPSSSKSPLVARYTGAGGACTSIPCASGIASLSRRITSIAGSGRDSCSSFPRCCSSARFSCCRSRSRSCIRSTGSAGRSEASSSACVSMKRS